MKSEFEFIENLKAQSAIANPQSAFRYGIGDDCAVLPKDSETDLVVTTDLLVEEIDFRIDWTTPEFLGHKALAVSLSDVGAMGAKPVWAMLSIGVPEEVWKSDFVEKFYDGWFRLAEKFNVELVGGDVSRTPDKIVIDSIAAGETRKGKAVLRSGAKPDDLIFVTGSLGGAAVALKLLENGERYEKSKRKNLLLRQLAPNAQTEIGRILGAQNLATAMIDLSDGLSSDLTHLCRASRVGARIFADRIPFEKSLKKFQIPDSRFQIDANPKSKIQNPKSDGELNFALNGGEDFELLFTVNPKKKFRLEKALQNFSFSRIGEVTANVEMIELVSVEKISVLEPKGFRHF